MILLIIGIGIILLLCGLIITTNNAAQFLAGYNTMSESERATVDLNNLISFNKKFHIALGLSTILIGSMLYYTIGQSKGLLFVCVYPLLAYLYYIPKISSFHKDRPKTKVWLLTGSLGMSILLVGATFYYGNRANTLELNEAQLIINGPYGDEYDLGQVTELTIVDDLPQIKYKKNGYATEDVRKGVFKTEAYQDIKLITDNSGPPYLFINIKDQNPIYFCQEGTDINAFVIQFNKR